MTMRLFACRSLLVPIAAIILGIYQVRTLVHGGELVHMRFPSRSFKDVFLDMQRNGNCTSLKGIGRKIAVLFIAISDKRFRGNWAKTTPRAKFWYDSTWPVSVLRDTQRPSAVICH